MTGFEPATFCTQNKRATKLRYIPVKYSTKFIINHVLMICLVERLSFENVYRVYNTINLIK